MDVTVIFGKDNVIIIMNLKLGFMCNDCLDNGSNLASSRANN